MNLCLGDSLAVGVAALLSCNPVAYVGASSYAILNRTPTAIYDNAVISAGTNDPPGAYVAAIRARIRADRVVWILPVNAARDRVRLIADSYGDTVCAYVASRTGWPHPVSYAPLAACIRKAWR